MTNLRLPSLALVLIALLTTACAQRAVRAQEDPSPTTAAVAAVANPTGGAAESESSATPVPPTVTRAPRPTFTPLPTEAPSETPTEKPTEAPSKTPVPPSETPTEEPTATETATETPTEEPTATPEPPTATPEPVAAAQDRVVLSGMTMDYQKLNNCGPTSTSVLLSYYGISRPQLTIAGVLKPIGGADKNVSPPEIAGYVRGLGLGAFVGVNATTDQLERMLSAGFPFLAEQWMEYDGGVGHYRIVRGFDRAKQQILYNDTFLGPDRWTSYAQFFSDWSAYNNTYIVFYPLEREAELRAAIGADWNAATMWERLRAESQARIANGNANGYVWYGLGEALHQQGRDAEAVEAYEQAIAAWLPWRYLWYRYGYFEALNNVGAFEKTLEVTAPVLQSMVRSEDIHYHRGVALRGLGSTNPAIAEFRAALGDNPNFVPAQVALRQMGVDATAPPPPAPTTAAQPTAPPSSPPPSAPEPTSPPEPTAVPVEPTAAPPEPTAVPVEPTAAPPEPTAVPVEPTAIPPEPTVPPPPEPTAPPPEPTSPPAEPPPPQPTPGDRGG